MVVTRSFGTGSVEVGGSIPPSSTTISPCSSANRAERISSTLICRFDVHLSALLLMLLATGEVSVSAKVAPNYAAGTANKLTNNAAMSGHLNSASGIDPFKSSVDSVGALKILTRSTTVFSKCDLI